MIPYGRQSISQQDIEAVVEVLKSDYLTQGPVVPKLEQALAGYCGAQHAVAVNSATSALHIACLSLGLGVNDYLWTTPNTFVASANCALYCGAKVDFVDIDSRTYNMCPVELEKKLIKSEREGKLPKIVIPVHFAGQSCEMEKIHRLSQKYGFKIIEDASHAIGGKYKNKSVGSCQYSDITVFSFHPVKIITTAEGGMALTNNTELAIRMRQFQSHGITRDPELMTKEADGPWYYQQLELGFNYRMTELQAALGLSQLKRLDEFVLRRHEIAELYNDKLVNLPLSIPFQHTDCFSAFHLYPILLHLDKLEKNKKQIFEELRTSGIGVNIHYIPVHTQPYFKKYGFVEGNYPQAESYYKETLSIPLYPDLTREIQSEVIRNLELTIR